MLDALGENSQVCSCNNVNKGAICSTIREKSLCTLDDIKKCTKAGTGCGGCLPLLADLFKAEMAKSGQKLNNSLCEHFAFTRQELFEIVKVKGIKSFNELARQSRDGKRLRDLQAGHRVDPGKPLE